MSIASLGVLGSLAGTALPQRAAETDRADRESTREQRAAEATQQAENAAGIGQTEEDSQTSERDADGRRPWEEPARRTDKKKPDEPAAPSSVTLSKDPSGATGGKLDIVG